MCTVIEQNNIFKLDFPSHSLQISLSLLTPVKQQNNAATARYSLFTLVAENGNKVARTGNKVACFRTQSCPFPGTKLPFSATSMDRPLEVRSTETLNYSCASHTDCSNYNVSHKIGTPLFSFYFSKCW